MTSKEELFFNSGFPRERYPVSNVILSLLARDKGSLCTYEEIAKAIGISISVKAISRRICDLSTEKELPLGLKIVAVRGFGYFLEVEAVNSLSQLGVSPFFGDYPGELRSIKRLSLLSQEKINRNSNITPERVVGVMDGLYGYNSCGKTVLRPILAGERRELVAFLANQGLHASGEQIVVEAYGRQFVGAPDYLAVNDQVMKLNRGPLAKFHLRVINDFDPRHSVGRGRYYLHDTKD